MSIHFDSTPNIIARINSGTPFDVVVVPVDVFKDAAAKARFAPGPTVDIARVGYGVIVRAGAPKPDISTPDASRRRCSRRPSIAFVPASAAGAYITKVFERLGIAEEMKAKTKVQAAPAAIAPAVAKGEAELGVFLTNVLIAPGVELVGPFPGDLQQELVFTSAVAADSKEADAAKALIDYLKTPAATAAHQSRRHDAGLTGQSMTSPRLATYSIGGAKKYGAVTDGGIVDLSARFGKDYPTLREVIEAGALTKLAEDAARRSPDHALDAITWQPPIPAPEKIICIGVNYPDRNAEYKDGQDAPKYPSMFMRTPRSFVGHNAPLVRPRASAQLDYEGELVLVIGKAGRHINESAALDHIAAVTLCNEGTIRDWVRHAKFNVTQGKNFDSTGSLGPWLVPYTDEAQIADIRLTTRVNGETRQDDRTGRLIFGFRYLLNYISTFTTLVPGDVIVTGTPTGAGARFDPPRYLKPGDVIEVEAEGVGSLRNGVVDEA